MLLFPSIGFGSGGGKVRICHKTGSQSNPYVLIRVSPQGANAHLSNHPGDFRVRPGKPCPPHDGNGNGNGDDDGNGNHDGNGDDD